MSEIIANWLKNEIELSKQIDSFEADFANGYLFGELLFKFNQQPNFKEFSKENTVIAKQQNFQKLITTVHSLNIKDFNSKTAHEIIDQKKGIALQLLYRLKMALEKVYPPTDISVLQKTGKMGDNQPAMKIVPQREQYDKLNHKLFENRLQALSKPQKAINIEKHQKPFLDERLKQEKQAKNDHKEALELNFRIKAQIRSASINKLQRNAGFMEEWQQKGVDDWKTNQTIKKVREKNDLEFQYSLASKYNKLTMGKIEEANKEVNNGIADFEQTLKSKGINTRVNKDEAAQAIINSMQSSPMKSPQVLKQSFNSSVGRPTGLGATLAGPSGGLGATLGGNGTMNQTMLTKTGGMTLTSTGLKTKDKKTVTEQTRKERERRRRKMIVDQNKTYTDLEHKKRENQIVERMNRKAKQEEELAYEQWRTLQCKNIMTENRNLREARYEKRRELDQQNSNMREEEMLNSMKKQMEREMATLNERDVEMRIVHKQAKRSGRAEYSSVLFDAIFDIANEAYVHQQKADSNEIDPKNWHEWLQLFIEEFPIAGTLEKSATTIQDLEQQSLQQQQELTDEEQEQLKLANAPQKKLDHIELIDYLTNNGQWSTELVTQNKPNLEHILTGVHAESAAPTGGAKGGKGAPAKAAAEQIQLEEGDTELPELAPNNFILGDAIENIININFEDRPKYKRPKVPHYLTLKLCLVGYSFSGKNTQAQRLMQDLGLQIYKMGDLVQEALDNFNSNPNPIDSQAIINNIDEVLGNMSMDSELHEEYDALEDFRQCGAQIKDLLSEGHEIPDALYVKLFIAKLRFSYIHKTKQQLKNEVQALAEKEIALYEKVNLLNDDLNEDIDFLQHKKKKHVNMEQLQKELMETMNEIPKVRELAKSGWVLVDFPSNFAQAKLLEAALSGFVPKSENDPIQREKELEDALLLVQPNARELPPQELVKSGLDAVIWFQASRKECQRRAIGRRYDNFNEKMYHVEDQPPLTTCAPLCERLKPMDQEENSESTLIDKWVSFDENSKGLTNWLLKFGDSDYERSIFQTVQADNSEQDIYNEITEIVNNIIEIKTGRQDDKLNEIINDVTAKKQAEEERLKKIKDEEEAQKLLEAEEGYVAPEPTKEETGKLERANRVVKPEVVSEKIGAKPAGLENVDTDFQPIILKLWLELCTNYKSQMRKIFSQVRGQRERMISQQAHISKRFLQFLHRPDLKQEKLEGFIRDFNEFSDQFIDLREDDQTKDELHQRVDILSDEMWEIIEERKDQNVEERKKIMESGWIEYELAFAVECTQKLMQAEVDKFKQSVQIIHDYYHTFEDKLIPEALHVATVEIFQEGEELPPVEVLPEGADHLNSDHYQYPRLDKIYERALKSQVVVDVTQLQAVTTDKKGAPVKGGAKDQKKPNAAGDEEKALEESAHVKQMKEAIKVEKAIFRYRLTLLRNWTLKGLKEMRQKCQKMYHKLEDWILVAVKTENEAVEDMCIVIKTAIEEQRKIQNELRIKFMDFCVDEKVMNYIEPPPEKLPAMEQLQPSRYSIKQLTSLIDELEEIAQQQGSSGHGSGGVHTIPNKLVVDYFLRKLENSKSLGDESGLPDHWNSFTEYDLQKMVRNLDKYNHGSVNWKQLATFICLLQSDIATDKDADAYYHHVSQTHHKDGFINESSFVKIKTWFDEVEYSQDKDEAVPFLRVQFLKELLFRIHKENKDGELKVHVKKFLTMVKAKELSMFKRDVKTFNDLLFAHNEK